MHICATSAHMQVTIWCSAASYQPPAATAGAVLSLCLLRELPPCSWQPGDCPVHLGKEDRLLALRGHSLLLI